MTKEILRPSLAILFTKMISFPIRSHQIVSQQFYQQWLAKSQLKIWSKNLWIPTNSMMETKLIKLKICLTVTKEKLHMIIILWRESLNKKSMFSLHWKEFFLKALMFIRLMILQRFQFRLCPLELLINAKTKHKRLLKEKKMQLEILFCLDAIDIWCQLSLKNLWG